MLYEKKGKSTSSDFTLSLLDSENVSTNPVTEKKIIYGYKHKLTSTVYHHAVTQTLPSPWKYDSILKFHRETQTIDKKDKAQQTSKNVAIQVDTRNICIYSIGDKCLTYSGCFLPANYVKEDYLSKVVVIQKYTRRWLAYQEVFRRKKKSLLPHIPDEEKFNSRIKLDIDSDKGLYEKRLNPRRDEDFLLRFSDLQGWCEKKVKCINSNLSLLHMGAAFWSLENEELRNILGINQKKYFSLQKQDTEHKENSEKMAVQPKSCIEYNKDILIETSSTLKGKYFQDLYQSLSMKHVPSRDRISTLTTLKEMVQAVQPKSCIEYNKDILIETSSTLKGKYFQDLYQSLSMKHVPSRDRISTLTTLKEMVQNYHCKLSENIVQLANREIDLLLRNTKSDRLEGLRSRIQNLFRQLVRQPVYNPLMKTLQEKDATKRAICCASCKCFYTLKPNSTHEGFEKSVKASILTKCAKCSHIENEAWIRKDFEMYKKLLKILIKDEETRPSISGLIYVLQPRDIKHLLESIWKGESCISGLANKDDLEFTRYDFEKSWTPWNCLLVTRQETQLLQETPHPEWIYDEQFKERVLQRHASARVYFSTIPRFFPYTLEHR